MCANSPGSFSCNCKEGFSGDGINCSDINECNFNPCGNRSVCNNIVGSYTCSCEKGTRRLENGVCQGLYFTLSGILSILISYLLSI